MSGRDLGHLARVALVGLLDKDALTQAAALAFYTALGLAPMVLLAMSLSAALGASTQQALLENIASLIGGTAADGVDLIIRSSERDEDASLLSSLIAMCTMVLSVAGIFTQFQAALNRIWDVEAKPADAWRSWLRTRLLSMGMFLSILFLMLVSLVMSAGIALLVPTGGGQWIVLNGAISMLVYVVLFALIFKFLPDAVIAWRDVWIGAAWTAVLFAIGKEAIGLYLGQAGVATSYGAAGSLIALLVWVYYSALIVLLGAEVTRAYAHHSGRTIQPSIHATALTPCRQDAL